MTSYGRVGEYFSAGEEVYFREQRAEVIEYSEPSSLPGWAVPIVIKDDNEEQYITLAHSSQLSRPPTAADTDDSEMVEIEVSHILWLFQEALTRDISPKQLLHEVINNMIKENPVD